MKGLLWWVEEMGWSYEHGRRVRWRTMRWG